MSEDTQYEEKVDGKIVDYMLLNARTIRVMEIIYSEAIIYLNLIESKQFIQSKYSRSSATIYYFLFIQ